MDIYPSMNRSGLRIRIAEYTKFLLRWGWFAVLLILLSIYITSLIPDAAVLPGYEATLNIQENVPSSGGKLGLLSTTTFFADILKSPGTLNLAIPTLEKDKLASPFDLTYLESIVTATPVTKTSIIQLTATWTSQQGATLIVNTIYQSFLQNMHSARALVTDKLKADLTTDLVQAQADSANTATVLQNLFTSGHTDTSEYELLNVLHGQEEQRISTINNLLAQIGQQGFGSNDILQLSGTAPSITTLQAAAPTMGLRLELAPLVGLIMGLGGILLAARFSNKLPLRGQKREVVLPRIGIVIPAIAGLNKAHLQVPEQILSQCIVLLRRLKRQEAEHEKRIKLITVTSSQEKEGKSTVATELALSAAQIGYQTLLIDANPGRPVIHSWFDVPNTQGTLDLVHSLAINAGNDMNLSPIVVPSEPKLGLIPIGTGPVGDPTEMQVEGLRIDGLSPLLTKLCNMADLVIFDSSSLLTEPYASNVAMLSDMVLFVVDANKSQSTKVREASQYLSDMRIPYTTVLNRAASTTIE